MQNHQLDKDCHTHIMRQLVGVHAGYEDVARNACLRGQLNDFHLFYSSSGTPD